MIKKYNLIFLFLLLVGKISFAGTMTNATINTGEGGKSTFNKNGKNGEIFINNQYLDIKECFNKLNIPYNETKVKITLIDNQNIKINDKTIKIDKCLVK